MFVYIYIYISYDMLCGMFDSPALLILCRYYVSLVKLYTPRSNYGSECFRAFQASKVRCFLPWLPSSSSVAKLTASTETRDFEAIGLQSLRNLKPVNHENP